MKVLQLALAGVLLAALTSSLQAQEGMMGNPYSMQAGYGGYPGMGYPQGEAPAGYPGQGSPMMSPQMAQQALYGQPCPGGCGPQMQGPMQSDQMMMQGGMQGGPMPMEGGPMDDGQGGGPCYGPAQAECYNDGQVHYIYGTAELFYARRNNTSLHQPVVELGNPGGPELAGTQNVGFDYQPALKGSVGIYTPWGFGVEGDYWGQFPWSNNKTVVTGDNDLTLPGTLPLSTFDFFDADRMQITYSDHINNAELNFIRPYGSIQYIAGLRYLQINEKFNINSFDVDTGSGDYTIQAHNYLYGPQLGVRGQWEIWRLAFDVSCKAALCADAGGETQFVTDSPNGFVLRDASARDRWASFVGEVAAYVTMPLGSYFTARAGYTGIWIEDIALAPDQLDFSDTPTSGTALYHRGAMMIHGFNLGLEARW